jgi:aspartate/methionine/tyrosine aminotransferase
VPKVRYDFRSSGITRFRFKVDLGEVDLSTNYVGGNPEAVKVLAQRYDTAPENVFVSAEGASGQNARIIRCLAQRRPRKNEAVVEFPTYEPLLRDVEEHFRNVKRLERKKTDDYSIDPDKLKKIVGSKTGLLVLTNPHAPSGAIIGKSVVKEVMEIASDFDFFVLCDEIYAEFDRKGIPTIFPVDTEHTIITSGFSKAYGLGGVKLGLALANSKLVSEFQEDVLSTIGNSPNIVQILASELLGNNMNALESHKNKWIVLRKETERFLSELGFEYFPNKCGVTFWVRLPKSDTYRWMEKAIQKHGFAAVPGAFFMFKDGEKVVKSDMIRLGLGNVDPDDARLNEAFSVMEEAQRTC